MVRHLRKLKRPRRKVWRLGMKCSHRMQVEAFVYARGDKEQSDVQRLIAGT